MPFPFFSSVANRSAVSNGTALPGRVPVLLPLPLAGVLDYAVPEGMQTAAGDIVLVPLGGRPRVGVVWDGKGSTQVPAARLKPIAQIVPTFRLQRSLRQFIDWVAAYTLAPPGDVLAMSLRLNALRPQRAAIGFRAAALPPDLRLTKPRRLVIDTLADQILPAGEIARRAGVSGGLVQAMLRSGWLERVTLESPATRTDSVVVGGNATLSSNQQSAASALRVAVAARRNSVTLLQGVTGSGKTEVYFEAVEECVAVGRQALILLPEIALSAQWLCRFEQRFGVASAVWHSDLGSRTRRETWRAAATGQAKVVLGARSALFLPFSDLGLIVVDEEHESAFKQEDGVVYHARDMAIVRGRLSAAPVILASATPSLETLANVEAGRYDRLDLPHRFGGASVPSVATIDLRKHPPKPGGFLSPILADAVQQTLDGGGQAMLFLNRRGYAPLTLCRSCGHRIECPNCTAWLVEHRLRRELTCHHCGYSHPTPSACPSCAAESSLTAIGPGVERITEEAAMLFPAARRLIMASDTLPGPHSAAAAAQSIVAREVDLIIGTQIVAKGWHFPHLTLVGVVDADLGLAGGDLRAGERTMQLLHQVAGRAGREQAAGRVLLQTHQPTHPVMRALVAGDVTGFMRAEAEQRRPGHWPPYGRLAALIVSAEDAKDADATARALGRAAPRGAGVLVLGPAPAPLAVLRGRHRQRLLLRTLKEVPVQPLLRDWLAQVRIPRRVRVDIDIDPISFM
jgi:primosomal protein N' (replication factor Y)